MCMRESDDWAAPTCDAANSLMCIILMQMTTSNDAGSRAPRPHDVTGCVALTTTGSKTFVSERSLVWALMLQQGEVWAGRGERSSASRTASDVSTRLIKCGALRVSVSWEPDSLRVRRETKWFELQVFETAAHNVLPATRSREIKHHAHQTLTHAHLFQLKKKTVESAHLLRNDSFSTSDGCHMTCGRCWAK